MEGGTAARVWAALREMVRELTRPVAVVIEAGAAAVPVAAWVVLATSGWLRSWTDISAFPIDVVITVIGCWAVLVLLVLTVVAAIQDDVPTPPDRYRPLSPPLWWMPPALLLLGLAFGWAFWR